MNIIYDTLSSQFLHYLQGLRFWIVCFQFNGIIYIIVIWRDIQLYNWSSLVTMYPLSKVQSRL